MQRGATKFRARAASLRKHARTRDNSPGRAYLSKIGSYRFLVAVGQPSPDVRRLNFGRFVRRAVDGAKERGLTIADVKLKTGIGTTTVYRWINGDWSRDPRPSEVRAFCEGLDVNLRAAYDALGWAYEKRTTPEPDLDPDLKIVQRRLLDPTVSEEEKRIIRATLQHLANIADRTPPAKRQPRKRTA